MRTAAKALLAAGAWFLAVAVVGGSVWLTVTSAEAQLVTVGTSIGPGAEAADDAPPLGSGRPGVLADPAGAGVPTAPARGPGQQDRPAAVPRASRSADRPDATRDGSAGGRSPGASAPAPGASAARGAHPGGGAGGRAAAPGDRTAGTVGASGDPGPAGVSSGTAGGGRTSPDQGTPQGGSAARTSPDEVPVAVPGGRLLVTCSPAGLTDLRAFTDPGWSGRWGRTDRGGVALWFTRPGEVQVLVVTCEHDAPSVRGTTLRVARDGDEPLRDARPGEAA